MAKTLHLREAVSVPDLLRRDRIVRRLAKLRADVLIDKNTIEWFSEHRLKPGEAPLSTAFEEAVIAWCDGKGPMPELPPQEDGHARN